MYILSNLLIDWYETNHRSLPWRDTSDPYLIWISEVILQQTRVNQGLDYYRRFVHRFPNVQSLASAPEQEVLLMWQGLGYYSRARNLHSAAKQIIQQYNGCFPRTYKELLSLKGIGDYTASAIASFAFDLPYATLDGNVFRLLSRFHAVSTPINSTAGQKEFRALAQQELNPLRAALHNQAMMEFGALHCTPSSPSCTSCPLQQHCKSFNSELTTLLPVKEGRTAVKELFLYYFIFLLPDGSALLRKRTAKGIWHNMYDYPCVECSAPQTFDHLINSAPIAPLIAANQQFTLLSTLSDVRHQLSHRTLITTFYTLSIAQPFEVADPDLLWVDAPALNRYPSPRLISIYRERNVR